MREVVNNILPNIKKQVKRQNFVTLIKAKEWINIDPSNSAKEVFIFRDKSELLISKNGMVQKGKWELLNNKSILIEYNSQSNLFYIDFVDDNVLFLDSDNKIEYKVFVDSNSFENGINDLEKTKKALKNKYLSNKHESTNQDKKEYIRNQKKLDSNNVIQPQNHINSTRKGFGIVFILIGILVMGGIVIFDNQYFRYHILNDKSMCPCGANLSTSIDPTLLFVFLILLTLFGILLFVRGFEKTK